MYAQLRRLVKGVLLLAPLTLLASCSHEMGCADSSTKSEVLEVVSSNMQGANWWMKALNQGDLKDFAVEDIQTTADDTTTRQHQCHAKLTWKYRNSHFKTDFEAEELEFDYETDFMEDKGKSEVRLDMQPITMDFLHKTYH
jgi:hypothetical protein